MKIYKTIIIVALSCAVLTGVIASILNKAESYSQLHLGKSDYILNFILGVIIIIFTLAFSHHPKKEKEITKIKWLNTRVILKWVFLLIAFWFLMVLTFGVNHGGIIETLHIIFTGLSIATGIFAIVTYPETKEGHLLANIGAVICIVGFSLGFNFHIYTTSISETIVSAIFAFFLLITWKFIK